MSKLKERVRKQLAEVAGWLAQDRLAKADVESLGVCLGRMQPVAVEQVQLSLPVRIVAEGRGARVHADVRDVPGRWPSVEYLWTFRSRRWATGEPSTFVETAGLPPGSYRLTVTARRGSAVGTVDATGVTVAGGLQAQPTPVNAAATASQPPPSAPKGPARSRAATPARTTAKGGTAAKGRTSARGTTAAPSPATTPAAPAIQGPSVASPQGPAVGPAPSLPAAAPPVTAPVAPTPPVVTAPTGPRASTVKSTRKRAPAARGSASTPPQPPGPERS
jgi:hypothetical protein